VIENMVARDGIEPPTPAFSGMWDQSLTERPLVVSNTYRNAVWTRFGPETAALVALDLSETCIFFPFSHHLDLKNSLAIRMLSRTRAVVTALSLSSPCKTKTTAKMPIYAQSEGLAASSDVEAKRPAAIWRAH